MTLDSQTAAERQKAYDDAVAALHRVNPKLAPVAKLEDAFSIPRVSEQARNAAPPAPLAPSAEARLVARVAGMQNSCAALVGRAAKLGIKTDLPALSGADPLAQLQALNKFHDDLEKQIESFQKTSPEERPCEILRQHVLKHGQRIAHIEKRLAAFASALDAISELLPHLMPKKKEPKK